MKENLGDILYFLAMIAFFVISAIAKSKKAKKKVVPPPKPVEKPEKNVGDGGSSGFPWLDEIFKEEEQEVVEEQVPDTGTETEAVKEVPVDDRIEIKVMKEELVDDRIEIDEVVFEHENFIYSTVESEDGGSYWDEEEFDLRRAVIFSEILKRPEL